MTSKPFKGEGTVQGQFLKSPLLSSRRRLHLPNPPALKEAARRRGGATMWKPCHNIPVSSWSLAMAWRILFACLQSPLCDSCMERNANTCTIMLKEELCTISSHFHLLFIALRPHRCSDRMLGEIECPPYSSSSSTGMPRPGG